MEITDPIPTSSNATKTEFSSASDQEVSASQSKISAVWLRIPDAMKLSGISRSKLYELIRDGKIRSASLRDAGQSKATRLISRESLLAFIDSHASGGNA